MGEGLGRRAPSQFGLQGRDARKRAPQVCANLSDVGGAPARRHSRCRPLLFNSDDDLSAGQVLAVTSSLKELKHGWRDQKHMLGLRPVYR